MIKYKRYKDFSYRKNLKKNEQLHFLFTYLLQKKKKKKINKFKLMLKKQLLYKLINTKIINRCINSNKIRSVTRVTNLTKNSFKHYYSLGDIMGFKKSS